MGDANLLHDAGLALGKCDMATRLIADKLDLDLAALTAALLIIVVVVVHDGEAWPLSTTALGCRAVSDGLCLVELVGRGLVVLLSDVGHCVGLSVLPAWSC